MKEKLKKFLAWYFYSSTLVGVPLVLLLFAIGMQKFIFTTTCTIIGYKCEYALGAQDAMANYMGDLLSNNPGKDIVVKPHH